MQINLKQAEIVSALKMYIASQGINISGKDVSIAFTAGRKESGISAEISIDDVAIPGFTDLVEVPAAVVVAEDKPALSLVVAPVDAVVDAEVAQEEAPAEPEAAAVKPVTSLFS